MIAIGMDVGQAADYSALVFIRRVSPSSASGAHVIDNIVRYPLGMPYPDLVANVVQRHLTNKHQFAIDNTGVGRAVADEFERRGHKPTRVSITGGNKTRFEAGSWRVPRNTLFELIYRAIASGRLKLSKNAPHAGLLMEEMRNIRPTHTNTGRVSYQAINPTVHDDLLFAALLAWWRVCNNIRSVQ